MGIPKTELLINLQVKIRVSRQGVFSHLLSLNSVVTSRTPKLDVDLGYVSNDRSEFEDSDCRFANEIEHLQLQCKIPSS
jgi:hypothetical protein